MLHTATALEEPRLTGANESRIRLLVAGGVVAIVATYIAVTASDPSTAGWSWTATLLYPVGLMAILWLERRWPADPSQKVLSTGLVHDALWVLLEATVSVAVVSWYSPVVHSAYRKHLSFLTLPIADSLPTWARLSIGFIVLDLARWCQHWLHHHVTWLWPFHAVHHAQRELNIFSDYRIHFMELFVRLTVQLLPLLMLGLQPPAMTWWLLLLVWHSRFYHANIRTNLGWLRYLVVTPQSHRVHHSRNPSHFNRNYGAMLSVWDQLFGTQHRRYDEYPQTGIDDEAFPREHARTLGGIVLTPLRQMAYPFILLLQRAVRRPL